MNISIKSARCCRILSTAAVTILSALQSQASSRSVCAGSPANLSALQNLTVTASGAGTFHSTVTLAGGRGCAYVIDTHYTGTGSGLLPTYDYAYAQYTLQDGIFYGSALFKYYNNKANPFKTPFFRIEPRRNTNKWLQKHVLYYRNKSNSLRASPHIFN